MEEINEARKVRTSKTEEDVYGGYDVDELLSVDVEFEKLVFCTKQSEGHAGWTTIQKADLEKYAQRKLVGRNTFKKSAPFINAVVHAHAKKYMEEFKVGSAPYKTAQDLLKFQLKPLESSKFILTSATYHKSDFMPLNSICLLCNNPEFFVFMDDYHAHGDNTILYSFSEKYFESIKQNQKKEGKGLPNITAAAWLGNVKEKDLEQWRIMHRKFEVGKFIGKKPYYIETKKISF